MIRESTLVRAADKVSAYLEKYVKTVGVERKEEMLELFENMHRLFPHWVIMTCPAMHPDIRYVSKNAPYVFEHSSEHLIHNGRIHRFFENIPEVDQPDVYQCFQHLHDFLESIPPEEHHRYRAIIQYRYRKPNGQIIFLHDEKATLTLGESGNLYYALFRDVTGEKTFSGVKIELFRHEETLKKISEFKPSASRNTVSKREQELIDLIKQGLSTKEIAWYLNISPNTVRNIKSKLFVKFKVTSSIELLNMAS
jgi:DNA-binding CsgD family transcriptional regulator